jgi:hypothetical protein
MTGDHLLKVIVIADLHLVHAHSYERELRVDVIEGLLELLQRTQTIGEDVHVAFVVEFDIHVTFLLKNYN